MSLLSRLRAGRRPAQSIKPAGVVSYVGTTAWGDIPLPELSASSVFGIPAANRAVTMIANAVASMAPMRLWTPDGYISDKAPNILTRPNANHGSFEFWSMVTSEVVVHGNFLAIQADFDALGYPQQVVPIPYGFWLAEYDQDGRLVYKVGDARFSPEEVVHVRLNATPNSPYGLGVVAQFRRSLGAALDQQALGADTYRSGNVPAGIIELDLPEVSVEQADAVATQWLANHAGGRAPAVLPNTMKFHPLQWSPEDLDFLSARSYTVAEIAFMFGLDPTDLGATLANGTSLTYANIEQRTQQRITDSYGPHMRRIEDAWSDLLPGDNKARFQPENLLRTDSKTRIEVEAAEIAAGVRTLDEVRKARGLRPVEAPEPEPVAAPVVVEDAL